MSVGPLGGLAASVAATPLAQTAGSEVERTQQATGVQQRRLQNDVRAENAAGIGQTDEDHETADRDANGRRAWEQLARDAGGQSQPSGGSRQSKDASHQSGNLVDLTG